MDILRSCEGPSDTLSPAGTSGDKWPSLHLGRSSTYKTISAAISANGRVTLLKIDQLQCAGRGLSHLLNQLRAGTFTSRAPSADLSIDWAPLMGSLGGPIGVLSVSLESIIFPGQSISL